MRLEQTVTVRLGLKDVAALKKRQSLTVACACGQHITLAWDGEAPKVSRVANATARARMQALARQRWDRIATETTPAVTPKRRAARPKPTGYPCSRCRRVFPSALGLRVHVLRAHKGVGPQKQVKTRKSTTKANGKTVKPTPKPSTVVGHAAKHFCTVDGCAHAPFTSVQGMVMHRRRAHEGFNPTRLHQQAVAKAARA